MKTSKKKNKLKNAVIILYNNNQFLMVRDRIDKKWMFPGGGININENPFDCAKREFYEETKLKLNKFGKIKFEHFIYKEKTIIYYGKTKKYINPKYINTNETDKLSFISLSSILKENLKIKSYVIKSFRKLLKELK